jgi:NifU-like protein involved in Fe-S cluster formation
MGYSAAVLERARDPKNTGWLPRDAPDVGTGEVGAAGLETVVRIQVRVNGSTRRIDEAVFKARVRPSRWRARAWWWNG